MIRCNNDSHLYLYNLDYYLACRFVILLCGFGLVFGFGLLMLSYACVVRVCWFRVKVNVGTCYLRGLKLC